MSDYTVVVTEQPTTVSVDDRANTTVSVSDEVVSVVTAAEQGPVGAQGPAGPQGSQGPAGTGGDLTYTQSFSSVTSITITHNLHKYPSVMVLDTAGDEVECDVDLINANQLTLNFGIAFSGSVVCN